PVAGAERDHEEHDPGPGKDPERALVLPTVEEEQQARHEAHGEHDRVDAAPELPRDQRLEARLHLRDEVALGESCRLQTRGDADEQVLRELVERVVLVEEREDAQRQERREPDAGIVRDVHQASPPGAGAPRRDCWTTLPSTMQSAMKTWVSDCASMPRVAVP